MRVTGMWPTANDSRWYICLTIGMFVSIGIVFPMSLFVNVFFVKSLERTIDQLFLSLSCWCAIFKIAVIYWRRDIIRELLHMHTVLSGDMKDRDRHNRTIRVNYRVHAFFVGLYFCCLIIFVVQSVYSKPDEAVYSSTEHWPSIQHRAVYLIVLIYQVVANFCGLFWASLEDAFYIALINVVGSHLVELKERLKALGHELTYGAESRNSLFYKHLIECCERYENCLR